MSALSSDLIPFRRKAKLDALEVKPTVESASDAAAGQVPQVASGTGGADRVDLESGGVEMTGMHQSVKVE